MSTGRLSHKLNDYIPFCLCRMGLPAEDEQRDEGEGGESQTEAAVRTPPPINKKRKTKKRYFVSHEHPDSS